MEGKFCKEEFCHKVFENKKYPYKYIYIIQRALLKMIGFEDQLIK